MSYQKFVEIGRVAYVSRGPQQGKLIAISDVIDHNRILVDGPCSDVPRHVLNMKSIELTKFKIKIGHGARTGTIKKAWDKAEINEKWAETSWAKKIEAKKIRASMTDYDRYKLMRAKQARRKLLNRFMGEAAKNMNVPKKTRKPRPRVRKSAKL